MTRHFKILVSEDVPEGQVLVVSNPRAPATLHAAALADDGLLTMALLTLGRDNVTLSARHDPALFESIREAAQQVGAIVEIGD